jgi:hypothetical protein
MYKRKTITYTGKAFHTDKTTATWHAYADCNSKKGYSPMIGYTIISIDYDLVDTGNGFNATCTQVYRSNRIPKHLRELNRLEQEQKKGKKRVSKADYYKQHIDLLEPVNEQDANST